MFFIEKSFLPKDQNNSCFPLYVFNRESECHEEKCTMCGICFLTPKIPSIFLPISAVSDLLEGIHFSTKKSMRT
jgi:hypothetical protein